MSLSPVPVPSQKVLVLPPGTQVPALLPHSGSLLRQPVRLTHVLMTILSLYFDLIPNPAPAQVLIPAQAAPLTPQ